MRGSRSQPAIAAAFAARLNAIMIERGLNQSQVAAAMNGRQISSEGKSIAKGKDRMSVWCAGKNLPDEENLAKLAKALNVEATDLIPDAEFQAAARSTPEASMVLTHDGPALVRINEVFDLDTAIAIIKLAGTPKA